MNKFMASHNKNKCYMMQYIWNYEKNEGRCDRTFKGRLVRIEIKKVKHKQYKITFFNYGTDDLFTTDEITYIDSKNDTVFGYTNKKVYVLKEYDQNE